jgi:hypothetical protein
LADGSLNGLKLCHETSLTRRSAHRVPLRSPRRMSFVISFHFVILKLPAARYWESSTVRTFYLFLIRSLTPPQAAAIALAIAVQMKL